MSDHAADLASIRAGMRPLPASLKHRPGLAMQCLRKLCSASGRAVAVFALCFAAATLALRQERGPAPAPSSVSPFAVPTGKTGACVQGSFRP